MINTIKDNLMLWRGSVRAWIQNNYRIDKFPIAEGIIKHLNLKNVERVFFGRPNTLILISTYEVTRIPLDRLSIVRCRLNYLMLKKLTGTNIASYAPKALGAGKFGKWPYYSESRLAGVAIDLPVSRMDEMVAKAADFITKFHKETARGIVINEINFKRLFGRDFARLMPYLNDEYRAKLARIEEMLKRQLMGKPFKTVWFHGDYKIENVLFDTNNWKIKGIIDWDLSRIQGLPLLDIFYLLIYGDYTMSKENVTNIFQSRLLDMNLSDKEIEFINSYLQIMGLSKAFLKPILIMFWINHVSQRYRQQLIDRVTYDYTHLDLVIDAIILKSGEAQ